MKKIITLKLLSLLFLTCLVGIARGQNSVKDSILNSTKEVSGNTENPVLEASRIDFESNISLDGKLDESIWFTVPAATGFTQRSPEDGTPASQRTEARIIYTDKAIYVGIIAYDTAPDSIAATLFRRDGNDYSDWVYVNFDSYNDKRTAFTFAVNPRGVQKDILYFDDTSEDVLWDAVWETATTIHEQGWTAEIRIPLSQLRFNSKQDEQTWGINFQRRIARNEEVAFWSPTPQDESGLVSKFGRLQGITNLDEPRRLEVQPYFSESLTRAPEQTNNPFFSQNDFTTRLGGDIKYGITSDLTLTATLNPDFGQVEADPATINLSAFEVFFTERRPFFLEGNDIFNFGGTKTFNNAGNPLTFYSRRIGRRPQGNFNRFNNFNDQSLTPSGNETVRTDVPNQTTIIGAGKVSGKTRNGWSVGILDAVTASEKARFAINPTGTNRQGDFTAEPTTNYLVSRLKKDINEGNSTFGGFLSATNRSIDGSYFQNFLHESAYLGGVDFEHNFKDRMYTVSGTFSASQVNASPEALLGTQQSSTRYYNRVDSDYLSVDPNRTSLSGYATELSFQKGGGEHTRFSLSYNDVSPGYEANDLGFQNRADYRAVSTAFMYRETDPDWLRFYNLWTFSSFQWNYDGDNTGQWYNIGGFWQFENLWSFNANVNYSGKSFNDRLTRGGPVAERPSGINFNFNINTDRTKKLSFNVGNFHRWEPETVEFDHNYWAGITYRPTTFIQVSLSPQFGYQRDVDQFITSVEDPNADATFDNRYVFANIDQVNLSLPLRMNWTFSPDLSIETYVRPFIASGKYSDFKEFAEPRTLDFNIYGKDTGSISENDGVVTVDPDGEGPSEAFSFGRPDFNFRSLQTNAVFRWEFRPGSTLFVVWQQQRNGSVGQGDFNFTDDFSGIFDVEPTNVFLVKLAYWFGS